jgi:lysophospholipase L1-like esterase
VNVVPIPETAPTFVARVGKTGRTLALLAVFAALAQWAPLPEAVAPWVRWLPDDLTQIVPRFLRFEPDALPWEVEPGAGEAAPEAVDDAALLALATPEAAPAQPPATPTPAGPGPATSGAATPPTPAPLGLAAQYGEDTPLPPPPPVRPINDTLNLVAIEDPHGVMARFYEALARTAAGRGQTRVVHYGDSLITGDYITQTLRRLLQKKFGDGGHGFVLGGLTSPWYRRNNLDLSTSDDWHVNRITRPQLADGTYGLGAVSFRSETPGSWVQYVPRDQNGKGDEPAAGAPPPAPLNQSIGRIRVFAWGGPRAAGYEVKVDGAVLGRVEARQANEGPVFAQFEVPEGPHKVRLTTVGGGVARLFGVALERTTPGVIYDSLGVDGTRAKILRFFDAEHWYAQLRERDPQLLVLHYGTNEGEAADLGTRNYREDLLPVVRGLRAGLPHVPCLLVGPMDRADKNEAGELVSRPVVQRITDVQRRVAYMAGCAFFDTFRAMGGEGSMARWYRSRLGGGDMTHPTRLGADRIGAMIFASLMDGYKRHRPGAP